MFGVGRLTRHLFICLGPDCTDLENGERTWLYLKGRMKELNITGPDGPFYRTKCQCLRICTDGPICVVPFLTISVPPRTWIAGLLPAHPGRRLGSFR